MNRFDELLFLVEKTSKKEQHRIDKFLKRHNYDPKTRTIETDEVGKDGKKIRVKFKMTNGPVFSDTTKSYYDDDEYAGSEINMACKTLKRKPMISDGVLKHEEGHVAYKRNPDKYKDLYDKAKETIAADSKDKNEHGKNPEEYVADAYSAAHSKYGKNGFTTMINSLRASEKDIKDKLKKINKMNITNDEMTALQEEIKSYKEGISTWSKMIDRLKKSGQNIEVYEQALKVQKASLKTVEDKMNRFKTTEFRSKTLEPLRSKTRKDATEQNNEVMLRHKFVKDHVKESTDVLLDIYEAEYNGDITPEERDILVNYLYEKY